MNYYGSIVLSWLVLAYYLQPFSRPKRAAYALLIFVLGQIEYAHLVFEDGPPRLVLQHFSILCIRLS